MFDYLFLAIAISTATYSHHYISRNYIVTKRKLETTLQSPKIQLQENISNKYDNADKHNYGHVRYTQTHISSDALK